MSQDEGSTCSSSAFWQEPIVVGYAFGPKKMSTMGTVMAEASKTEVLWELEHEDSEGSDDTEHDHCDDHCDEPCDDVYHERCDRNPMHQSLMASVGSLSHAANGVAITGSGGEQGNPAIQDDGCDRVHPQAQSMTGVSTSDFTLHSTNDKDDTEVQQHQHHQQTHQQQQQQQLTSDALAMMEPPTSQTVIFSIGRYDPADDGTTVNNNNNSNYNHNNMTTSPPSPTANPNGISGSTVTGRGAAAAGTGFVTTNLRHIVRYFQSSCSSAGGSVAAEDELSATPTVTSATTGTSWTTTAAFHKRDCDNATIASGATNRRLLAPIRLKFVPLNPNLPLHEQGDFDLILHKLTEDILSCSLQQQQNKLRLKRGMDIIHATAPQSSNSHDDSHQRVQRLLEYKASHPECCLMDDPLCVQTLMSRSDIAHVLQSCLHGVRSASGRSVRTPRYLVVEEDDFDDIDIQRASDNTNDDHCTHAHVHADPWQPASQTQRSRASRLQQKLDAADIQYPLILKPLIAAGTKQSHYMSVLLGRSALDAFDREMGSDDHVHTCNPSKVNSAATHPTAARDECNSKQQPPCQSRASNNNNSSTANRSYLFQEYVNHNATLYKVYVLGDTVHVYRRHSLPDLPPLSQRSDSTNWTVKFDSQRPYPKLQDFGFQLATSQAACDADPVTLTATEVAPIVETLRQAFGLELFGFDILLSSSKQRNELLVVDVNYFPSYKEVPNFPSLLAQYLTHRVLESRREREER